jgi:hypothetical protein
MEKAAENPGGAASGGMGMAMGVAMAGSMGQAMNQPASPPPVPGGGLTYYVAVGQQQTGPFDMPTLQQQVSEGRLKAEMLVWREGMANWTAAGKVGELARLFQGAPPPIP